VNYHQGDATDEASLSSVVSGADVVVGALAPRGPLAGSFRDVYRTIARLADAKGVSLFVVGGFSSLRPAAGAPRFAEDLSHAPAEFRDEIVTVAALVTDDLPATSPSRWTTRSGSSTSSKRGTTTGLTSTWRTKSMTPAAPPATRRPSSGQDRCPVTHP
jgi:putative NADH-flavin reductase